MNRLVQQKLERVVAQHSQFLTRAARMLAAVGRGESTPKDAEFHEDEIRQLDFAASDLVVELTGSIPEAREWRPPGREPYEKYYWRDDDGLNWLRRYREGLQRSLNYLAAFLPETTAEIHMGDKISVGNANVVMSHSSARDIKVTGLVEDSTGLDASVLAVELSQLRKQLRAESDADDPSHDADIGTVALAEQAAKKGDINSAVEHLRSVGSWVLATATKIGVAVASAAIKQEIGLGE